MCKKILLFIYIATPFLCCGKRDSLAQFICLYRSKPLGRDKSPPSESVKKPCLLIKNKKESTFRTPFCFWRRERDSNPRNLSVQRFSRPPQSTTLPSLLRRNWLARKKLALQVWLAAVAPLNSGSRSPRYIFLG